ncbi:50S ribosomal protein L24 [Candidatus Aerophobetes bacterium]|nr:50S ribosomal protein L24 [Candidatus Aerophobetes bacterium]
MAKIKVGDEVIVLSGKDKGKRGKVIERIPAEGKVVVEGVNIVTRHIRPTRRGQESGIVKKEAPLFQSKVMLICPRCGKKTRVGMRILKTGEKLRYCKKCKEVVD